ncbi:MAG: endonuclease NucS [Chloroflexi bacterium]|nr:endonuclease NucS [Chloroflexota bacterium]
MSTEPQLFRVDPDTKASVKATEVDFSHLGLEERRDIQEWVVANPEILGDDLLIIAKEFSDFDRTSERLDLLAIDRDGRLVIIELKRDHSGADAHWQAIKYASYLRHATHEDILRMLATYERVSEAEAEEKILEHIETGSLENLNDDQRIILASHRFAPEVTSAVLWLNDKAQDENLITCVQIIPYQDGDVLYVQTNTIIPVVGTERYSIQIGGASSDGTGGEAPSSAGIKAARRSARNRDDEITRFCVKVEALSLDMLQNTRRTDSKFGWARGGDTYRWYWIWYVDRPPWQRQSFNYEIAVNRVIDGTFNVSNHLNIQTKYLKNSLDYQDSMIDELRSWLLNASDRYEIPISRSSIRPRHQVRRGAPHLDDALVEETASSMKHMIETFTPKIEEFVSSHRADE